MLARCPPNLAAGREGHLRGPPVLAGDPRLLPQGPRWSPPSPASSSPWSPGSPATTSTRPSSSSSLVVVALTVLVGFIKRVATTYTITDRRLHIKRGIISREVQETRLERVQNVNYNQSSTSGSSRSATSTSTPPAPATTTSSSTGVADPEDVVAQGRRGTGACTRRALGSARRRSARPSAARSRSVALRRRLGSSPAASRSASARSVRSQVKSRVLAAEVAVGGGLLEDRPVQVEVPAERRRAQVEVLVDQASTISASGSLPVPKVSTISETGWATPIA